MSELNFTRLADAPVLEEVPDGAKVYAEVDGKVYRVAGDNLGAGVTDFWSGDWDAETGGYYVLPTEDAEVPLSYAEFASAVERGIVRLLYRGSDYLQYAVVTACMCESSKYAYCNTWSCYLYFADSVYDTDTSSVSGDNATTTKRDPWPPRT